MLDLCHIANLPSDILRKITRDFLHDRDTLQLISTCKDIRNLVNVSIVKQSLLFDHPLEKSKDWHNWDDEPHLWQLFSDLDQNSAACSSHLSSVVTLICKYKDQGWGNRKSQLLISEVIDTPGAKCKGMTVCASPIARHDWDQLKLSFSPEKNKSYGIYYKVGHGGGHSFHVRDVKVYSLVYSD